jgi:hypothetical protein
MDVAIIPEDSKGVKIFTSISGNSKKKDYDFARFLRSWWSKLFALTTRSWEAKI